MDMLPGNSAGHSLQKVCFAAAGAAHHDSMKRIFKKAGEKDKKQQRGAVLLADQPKTAKKLMGVFREIAD